MTSVLDQMTAATRQLKEDRAATLTPVGTERGGPQGMPILPNDTGVFMSNEALGDHAKALRKFAADALAIATGIDVMIGVPEAVATKLASDLAMEARFMEREADRRAADRVAAEGGDKRAAARVKAAPSDEEVAESFGARMERLSADAKAATFTDNDAPAPEPDKPARIPAGSASATAGWTCPEHGDANLKELRSRKGREYMACQTCTEFEK